MQSFSIDIPAMTITIRPRFDLPDVVPDINWVPVDQTQSSYFYEDGSYDWQFNTPQLDKSVQEAEGYPGVLKIFVEDDDRRVPLGSDPSDRHRAEMSGSRFAFVSDGANPEELWIAYSMKPVSLPAVHWIAMFQLFALADNTPGNTNTGPVLKLDLEDGQASVVNFSGNADNSARVQRDAWSGEFLQEGKRYDIVWRVVLHGDGLGELDLWINGESKISVQGIDIGFGTTTETAVKYGLYIDDDSQTGWQPAEVIFSQLEMEQGVDALANRITDPIGLPVEVDAPNDHIPTGTKLVAPATSQVLPSNWIFLENSEDATAELAANGEDVILNGDGASYGAAARYKFATEIGATYEFTFTTSGYVGVRFGTTQGGDETLAAAGYNNETATISFVADAEETWMQANRQGSGDAVMSGFNFAQTASAPESSPATEIVLDDANWVLDESSADASASITDGVVTVNGDGSGYGAAASYPIPTTAGVDYEITLSTTDYVGWRVGTGKGDSDLVASDGGYSVTDVVLSFTASSDTSWLYLNRQGAGDGTVYNILVEEF